MRIPIRLTSILWPGPQHRGLFLQTLPWQWGKDITYIKVRSFNPYSGEPITVVIAKEPSSMHYFPKQMLILSFSEYKPGDKKIPFRTSGEFSGARLEGINYEQLIDWMNPGEGAFRVLTGDFVTTEDGTGIVHIAPTFGADDYRVAKETGVPASAC